MRRQLIRGVLPLVFCAVPPLAAALIGVSLPALAREFYFGHLTALDVFILSLGAALFLIQTFMAWRALRWRGRGFDERPDKWLSNLAQAAEWFPLLGLIGTVAGIMQTFAGFDNGGDVVSQQQVIVRYASAITATCSGLFMALVNLLPSWVVLLGRDLIRTLGGGPAPAPDENGEPAPTPQASRTERVAVRPAEGSRR